MLNKQILLFSSCYCCCYLLGVIYVCHTLCDDQLFHGCEQNPNFLAFIHKIFEILPLFLCDRVHHQLLFGFSIIFSCFYFLVRQFFVFVVVGSNILAISRNVNLINMYAAHIIIYIYMISIVCVIISMKEIFYSNPVYARCV